MQEAVQPTKEPFSRSSSLVKWILHHIDRNGSAHFTAIKSGRETPGVKERARLQ